MNLEPNLGASSGTDPLTSPLSGIAPNMGQPAALNCQTAMSCIEEARNPMTSAARLGELRTQLTHCAACTSAFDLEVRLRTTMTPSMSELPSIDLRQRITDTLARVDLGDLDITDF